jgi:hypothetical protein
VNIVKGLKTGEEILYSNFTEKDLEIFPHENITAVDSTDVRQIREGSSKLFFERRNGCLEHEANRVSL